MMPHYRDKLYRSTFDLYSRRKGQISDASITAQQTLVHRDELKQTIVHIDSRSNSKRQTLTHSRLQRTLTDLFTKTNSQTACMHVHECNYSRHAIYSKHDYTDSQLYNIYITWDYVRLGNAWSLTSRACQGK